MDPRIHPPVHDITDLLTFRLARLVAVNTRAGTRWLQDELQLTLSEWRVLGLVHAMQCVRPSEIAALLVMDKGQLSRISGALLDRGLLESRPCSRDGRTAELRTSRRGRALHARAIVLTTARNEAVVESLTRSECAEFLRLLQKMTAHNEALAALSEHIE